MAFHIFTTEGISCLGQYNRIDNWIAGDLGGEERTVVGEFLVDEFHASAAFEGLDPLLVWHAGNSSSADDAWGKYTPMGGGFAERECEAGWAGDASR